MKPKRLHKVANQAPGSRQLVDKYGRAPRLANKKSCAKQNRAKETQELRSTTSNQLGTEPPNSDGPNSRHHKSSQANAGPMMQTAIKHQAAACQYTCAGCQQQISDRYLLSACNKFWHDDCLKCDRCQAKLGELGPTLYERGDMNLCRQDYFEMFGRKAICTICDKLIYASEMVMRARDNVYHLECFACQLCGLRFCVGDRFHLFENKIVCQYDYDEHILPIQESMNRQQQQQQQLQMELAATAANQTYDQNSLPVDQGAISDADFRQATQTSAENALSFSADCQQNSSSAPTFGAAELRVSEPTLMKSAHTNLNSAPSDLQAIPDSTNEEGDDQKLDDCQQTNGANDPGVSSATKVESTSERD